jgi:DNA phosphorothioation-associated putative methyltransferase
MESGENRNALNSIATSRGTFQKYYSQVELRAYIEGTLEVDALPAAPGVFYGFRDESFRQRFLADRYRRTVSVPPMRTLERRFAEHGAVLEPFMAALARLGRIPGPEDLPEYAQVVERFGSAKRALMLVNRVTGADAWTEIAAKRAEDLLVYLALSRFPRRPPLSALPLPTQRDARAFFGSYARACAEADALLFRAGDAAAIDAACRQSKVGRLVDNALLLHRSALPETAPLLRIYEGCARALVGEVEEADVIKLHRHSGKVSYLAYRDFETEAHPLLRFRIKVTLPTLSVEFFDHSSTREASYLKTKTGLNIAVEATSREDQATSRDIVE